MMINIDELKFDEKGLIPAIVVDAVTKKVLTLAYMNKESLKISMEKGLTCFYSRSRQELWLKGETSGNYQHIVSITADCDKDALTVVVEPDGPACHTGNETCFFNPVWESEELHEFSYEGLIKLMCDNPRARFKIKSDPGFTVFKVDEKYKINPDEFLSMGKATPFEGAEVYGRCLMTVCEGKVVYNAFPTGLE